MGVVFQAEDTVLKRLVAIKAILPGLNSSQRARERFLREAQSAAKLQHDNVATVYDVAEANGVPFLAMELLKGEGLDARLQCARTCCPSPTCCASGRRRPKVSPLRTSSAWSTATSNPPISSWSRRRGASRSSTLAWRAPWRAIRRLTKFGTTVGTVGYLSPEQAKGKPLDGRSDLFSLGCVLYRLVTGEPPFQGNDMLSMLTALATTTPPPANQINPEVPAPLSDLIMRLLSRNRDNRPNSGREVSDALHAIAVGLAAAPTPAFEVLEEVKQERRPERPQEIAPTPALEILEEVDEEPAAPAPLPAPITQTPRVAAKKVESATTERPAARRIRTENMERDRPRRRRRQQAFPSWLPWVAGGVALVLVGGGVAAFFLLRNTDKTPKAVEAQADNSRPATRDAENPQKPAQPGDQAKADNPTVPNPPPNLGGSQWLAFSPDNQHFVSAAPNGDRIVVWDRQKREPEYVIDRLVGGVTQAPCYSSDGKKLLAGIGQRAVLYDVGRKQTAPLCAYAADDIPRTEGRFGHGGVRTDRLVGIGFGDNNTALAVFYGTASSKRVLGLFDVERKQQRASGYWFFQDGVVPKSSGFGRGGSKPTPDAALKAAIPTPDGKGIVVVDASAMRVWLDDANPAKAGWSANRIPSVEPEPKCFALAPDGKTLLTSHGRNVVNVWNAKTGEALKSFTFGNGGEIDLLGFSPDGKLGMCSASGGKIYIWDAETGAIRAELPGQGPLFALAMSPDLRTVIASSTTASKLTWLTLPPKP